MPVIGISLVRDEADIIEQTVSWMLTQVDCVLIMDNGSVDGTREILDRLDVTVFDDPDVGHYQSRKMSWLAQQAKTLGPEWVVPFDADEFWYSPFGRIADVLTARPEAIATAAIFNHRPTGVDPRSDDPITRMGWRERAELPLHKVACRPTVPVKIHDGNHNASYAAPVVHGQLVVRHFPYRSAEQFERKARNGSQALAATNLPDETGQHWRDYGRLLEAHGPTVLHDVFREHFYTAEPAGDPALIFDPAPR